MRGGRSKKVDIARGIAMIAIVLGHLSIFNINRVVFTFHIPIFFVITGYFLKVEDDIGVTLKKRFRTLIVPYYLACVAIIISAGIISCLRNCTRGDRSDTIAVMQQWFYAALYGAGDSYQEPFVIKGIGAIWFLWATFWGIMILGIILKCKPKYRTILVFTVFAIGYFTRSICWFPLSIQAGCCSVLFMYVGYLVRRIQKQYINTDIEIKIFLFMISLVVWFSFICQFQSFWLVHCDIGRGPLDVIASLCACYAIIIICSFIEKINGFISNGLAFLGKYSLIMLVAHIIELNTFPWWILMEMISNLGYGDSVQLAVKIICKFIWIIGVTVVCAKTNWIRRLFSIKPLEENNKITKNNKKYQIEEFIDEK